MSTRADKPKAYFAKLLDTAEADIDYREVPTTTAADWEDAEVLLPVTAAEFRAIKQFIQTRRSKAAASPAYGLFATAMADRKQILSCIGCEVPAR